MLSLNNKCLSMVLIVLFLFSLVAPYIPAPDNVVWAEESGDATTDPQMVYYNINSETDIEITLTPNGRELINISDDKVELIESVEYEEEDNVYTIYSSYLSNYYDETKDEVTLTFQMNGGENPTTDIIFAQTIGDLSLGDVVVDPSWEWEHRTGSNYTYEEDNVTKPVTWNVVAKDHYAEGSVTLLSKELIGLFTFDDSTNVHSWGNNRWDKSGIHATANNGIRPWLNSTGIHEIEGFYNVFSESFKNYIQTTSVPNKEWENGDTYVTEDKVFIPSQTELGGGGSGTYVIGTVFPYFNDVEDADLIAQLPLSEAKSESWNYWTRSPSTQHFCFARGVRSNGSFYYDRAHYSNFGVRPALNLRSNTLISANSNEDIYIIIEQDLGDASVDLEAADYNLYSAEDIEITLTLNGRILDKIIDSDEVELVEGIEGDYTVDGNVYTILSTYLDGKEEGVVTLTFEMNGGEDPVTEITILPPAPQAIGDLDIGDKVVDPSWEWQFRTGDDYEFEEGDETKPVTWIVVAKDHYDGGDTGSVEDDHVTLITEDLIGKHVFDNSTDRGTELYGCNHWGNSGTTDADKGIRPWLNSTGIHDGEGFYNAMSLDFQDAILSTTLPNKEWEHGASYFTSDKIFLPSTTEMNDIIHDDTYEIGLNWGYFSDNESRKAQLGGENENHWMRSPDSQEAGDVRYVAGEGHFNRHFAYLDNRAVRPALNFNSNILVVPNGEGIYEIVEIANATTDPKTAYHSLNSESDIDINLTLNGWELELITDCEGIELKELGEGAGAGEEEAYTLDGNVYTIISDYLNEKEEGEITLTFEMSGGSNPETDIIITPPGTQAIGTLEIGDKVTDDSWRWTHKTGDNYTGSGETKSVTWIVVAKDHYDVEGGVYHVTLLSEELIGLFTFDNSTNVHSNGNNHWGDTGTHATAEEGIRPWLNSTGIHEGEGFYDAFSHDFKDAIMTTTVPNKEWVAGIYYETQDKVFLPSQTELGGGSDATYDIGTVFTHFDGVGNNDRVADLVGDTKRKYWTRSPDAQHASFVRGVSLTGSFYYDRAYFDNGGVRPALNLKADTPVMKIEEGAYRLGRGRENLVGQYSTGTFYYDEGSWTRFSGITAITFGFGDVTGDGRENLVGHFTAGTYYWDNGNWIRISRMVGELLAVGDVTGNGIDNIVAKYDNGTWYWGNGTWTRISRMDAEALVVGDITGNGEDNIVAQYPAGTYYWDNGTWTRISLMEAEILLLGDINGDGKNNIVAEYPAGTFYWDDGNWTKISTMGAEILVVGDITGNGEDNIVAQYPAGTYYWDYYEGWTMISTMIAEILAIGDVTGDGKNNIVAEYPAGTFYWDDGNWTRISTLGAEILVVGDVTGDGKNNIVGQYPNGTFYWDDGNWTRISGMTATILMFGDVVPR